MKKVYYYLFYKYYKFHEQSPSVWLSDWKAELFVDVIIIFLFFSFLIYYKIFADPYFDFGSNDFFKIFFVWIIPASNYFVFHYRNQWKGIIEQFDKLPRRRNKIGGFIVFVFTLLVIANFIFAFYKFSLVDWSLYR